MEINSALDFVRMTRATLEAAGFVRHERDGAVWFESDPSPRETPTPRVIPSEVEGSPAYSASTVRSAGDPSTSLGMTHVRITRVPTLVLVHGANDHAGTWFLVAPKLAQSYRILIPDLPGHGESAPRTGPLPISRFLETLETLLEHERDLTLIGNSLGGWLVLLYALRHPQQVKQLFLEASGGLNRPLSSPLTASNRDEAMVVLRAVHGPHVQPREWVIEALLQRANDSPMLRLTEVQEHLIERRLGEIDIPSTLIWGADDGVLPLSYANALQQAIRGSSLHVLEGAAHIPHMQQPERFLACLTAIS